jgi:hypothetical protein
MDGDERGVEQGLAPPQERDLPPGRLLATKEVLMRSIAENETAAGTTTPRRRASKRARLTAAFLVPAALVGGSLAYARTRTRTAAEIQPFVTCFQEASLSAPSAGFPLNGRAPEAVCNDAWTRGAVSSPVPTPVPATWTACVADSGGIDLFANADQSACSNLGLDPLPSGYSAPSRSSDAGGR